MSGQGGNDGGKPARPGIEDLARVIAQHNAMSRGTRFLPHGTRLFEIECGWEAFSLESGPDIAVRVESRREFETAVKNPDQTVIFIPRSCPLSLEEIEKICQRHGITKTLYLEVDKEQS